MRLTFFTYQILQGSDASMHSRLWASKPTILDTQQSPPHFIIRVDSKMESQEELPWIIGTTKISLE
jgi:hypothetical protein